MSSNLPVVFLAFANAPDDHLATLKDESRYLFRALQPLAADGRLEIHREESSGFDEFYQDLLAFDDRIVVFHYAGHADGSMLQMEGGPGDARGIAGLLGRQSSLKLVFLNGCATRDQVKLLHEAGVPAVIATAVKINDTRATHFASAFYDALAKGQGIYESFASAQNYIEGKFGAGGGTQPINRAPVYDFPDEEESAEPFVFEWTLYVRSDAQADLEQWRLPEAREAWQLQLEDANGPIKSPGGDAFLIDYRSRVRSLEVVCCERCGAKVAVHDQAPGQCRVCGSRALRPATVIATVPERVAPAALSGEAAENIAREQLQAADAQLVGRELVYLPYWIFDVRAQASYSAERGVLDSADTEAPRMAWSQASDTFDLELAGYAISAGTAPVGGSPAMIFQPAALDKAEPLQAGELPANSVPLDKDIGLAFGAVAGYLDGELAAEGRERVGGFEQRNVATDLRYKSLSVQSVLMPYWYVSASSAGGKACLAINAQTGAAHVAPIPGNTALFKESGSDMQQQSADRDRVSQRSSNFASIFGGIGIGIMVGLLLGLAAPAAKSVVSVFIGAVGVGLAALLGLNDKHFSTAKGLRIGSFGLAVAVSALSGIYVRDHGLLSPGLDQQVAEIREVFDGIDDNDAMALIGARQANGAPDPGAADGAGVNRLAALTQGSYLFSGVASDKTACDRLTEMSAQGTNAKLALHAFRFNDENNTLGWSALADRAQEAFVQEDDLKNFLFLSRDVVCGGDAFDRRVVMPQPQCQQIQAGARMPDELSSVFAAGGPETSEVLELVRTRITPGAQQTALAMLGPVLCKAKVEG